MSAVGNRVVLGLGSNLGDREAAIEGALFAARRARLPPHAHELALPDRARGRAAPGLVPERGRGGRDDAHAGSAARGLPGGRARARAACARERDGPRTLDVDLLLFGDARARRAAARPCPTRGCTSGASCSCPWRRSRPSSCHPRLGLERARAAARAAPTRRAVTPLRPGPRALMAFHYIAVEGADRRRQDRGGGAARRAARRAHRCSRSGRQNPFLQARSTTASPGAAFQAELFFLLSRYRQQQELLQRQLFQQRTLVRLRLREEQALRLPEPRRQRAAHLREALLAARRERAAPRPGRVPAGADRGAAEAHPRARPARGEPALRGVPGRGEPRLQPLLLPLHADAAAGREHRGAWTSRSSDGGRRRPPEADPQHGQGHAVLRAAGAQEADASRVDARAPRRLPRAILVVHAFPRFPWRHRHPATASRQLALAIRGRTAAGTRRPRGGARARGGPRRSRLTLTENRSVLLSFRRKRGARARCACTACSCTRRSAVVRGGGAQPAPHAAAAPTARCGAS